MIYPTTPCPENLKPVFEIVLKIFRNELASQKKCGITRCIYICHIILNDMTVTKAAKYDACKFISECLGYGRSAFGSWLIDMDWEYNSLPTSTQEERDAETNYENQARLAWLKFLVNSES
jgi:hypothetical protein